MTFLSGFDPPEEGENLVLFWGNFPMLINMISQESYILKDAQHFVVNKCM